MKIVFIFLFIFISCKKGGDSTVSSEYVHLESPDNSHILLTLTAPLDINSSNESSYTLTGTCSEEGEDVTLAVGNLSFVTTCLFNVYTSGSIDVSSLGDSGLISVRADHSDSDGVGADQIIFSVTKNTATPIVTINSPVGITNANDTSYSFSGTCSENGRVVTIDLGGISFSPNCSGGTWDVSSVNVSGLGDNPAIAITADHDNVGGTPAIQATTTVAKDSSAPTVTISAAPNINGSNETSYQVSGTCSENGRTVTVNVGLLAYTPSCSSGSWVTGTVDVSSLADNGAISVTADHDNLGGTPATQALEVISKNTATPSISSLSVPATLSSSVDLAWTLIDPGGFVINDYIINYRVKGTSIWLTFSDGVNTNLFGTVTSLTAATTYEFRSAVVYDTSFQSAWSATVEGETKPDDPLFSSPYAAMNVGGATSSNVVAMEDTTTVTLNGVFLISLSKGQTHTFVSAQFDVIDADKPIFTAGIRGSGGDVSKANVVWSPTAWAGKNFAFNAIRYNPQILSVYATENATIEVYEGLTLLASTTLTAGNGGILSWSNYGSYQVISTGTILAFHHSEGGGGTSLVDPKALTPSSSEIIGFPSSSMRLTTTSNGTNYTTRHSNSSSVSASLDKSDSITISPQGTSSLYRSESLLISADKSISGASFADSNGGCAASFLPTNLMKTRYATNIGTEWIAFASKSAGTIQVLDSSDTLIETLTLTNSGGDSNAPFKVRRGTTPAGYRFVSTVPVAAWYEPNSNTGGADNDETIMYGSN